MSTSKKVASGIAGLAALVTGGGSGIGFATPPVWWRTAPT
jgi:NADP-dependent 3-hydroxy acid dehydrogenase YdfG